MNEFWRKTFLFTLADFAALLLLFLPESFGITSLTIVLALQLVLGIALAFQRENKTLGQSLLASLGLSLLIGFSVCTLIIMNTNFHP